MNKKFLIVGLGNPGEEFKNTAHNIGSDILEFFADKNNQEWKNSKNLQGRICKFSWEGSDLFLLIPITYMNKSGIAVKEAMHWWDIDKNNLIVIHDDSDIELGRLKIGYDQASGGHKGVTNIIQCIGAQSFGRIKIGVRPQNLPQGGLNHVKSENFILKKIPQKKREELIDTGIKALEIYLTEGKEKAMSIFNSFKS